MAYKPLPASLATGHEPSADEFQGMIDETRRRGEVAQGRRTTASTATATIVGVLRLDNVAVYNGRAYRISTSNLNLISTVSNDDPQAQLRFSTSGTATTTSTLLPGGNARGRYVGATGSVFIPINAFYYPTSDATLSVLLCVTRSGGSGNVSIFADANNSIDLVIEDIGPAASNTGVSI